MGGMGQQFAQIAAEAEDDDSMTPREMYLAQLAATVASLDSESLDEMGTLLAQTESVEIEEDDQIGQLTHLLS